MENGCDPEWSSFRVVGDEVGRINSKAQGWLAKLRALRAAQREVSEQVEAVIKTFEEAGRRTSAVAVEILEDLSEVFVGWGEEAVAPHADLRSKRLKSSSTACSEAKSS